jgi:TonB family protein
MSQRYPIAAKKAKHEGNGILEITISADGGLGSALVKKSTGYPELDQAMLDSVKPCKFKHGSGDPAKAYDMPMRFRLEPN